MNMNYAVGDIYELGPLSLHIGKIQSDFTMMKIKIVDIYKDSITYLFLDTGETITKTIIEFDGIPKTIISHSINAV